MSTPSVDPLEPLAQLPGVPEAVAEARRAVDRLYGHRVMRRRAAEVTSESALRGARASAALDGADWPLEEVRRRTDFGGDPQARTVGGALRLNAEAGQLLGTWRHSPLQVLARLHLLAAGDLDPAAGRPRQGGEQPTELFGATLPAAEGIGAPDAAPVSAPAAKYELPPAPGADEAAARLDALAQLLAARGGKKHPNERTAPALVVAAVVHGELMTLRPFGSHNGLVARAAQRVVLIAEGLDPQAICPVEVGLAELGTDAYRNALGGYASGGAEGMALWLGHCAAALRLGVRESTAVCEAMQRGMV
ncbi:oxidoreductase [Streptacidiphilus sp. P02-A3a]|uniref:oxidoreductase n=1 Tax=Streptacidiphilus sp. P02-A3a TaxID=2704468 RepID=UPI0015F92C3C|nr:oxidoreductase [Streptacidiphilus sp. P02-A3a]QMU67219.1 oxidoreductase [Streptacidiphilus sp. P02-A3a]